MKGLQIEQFLRDRHARNTRIPGCRVAIGCLAIALGIDLDPTFVIVAGLILFGVVFALNSAVHSYLILGCAEGDKSR